MSNKIELSYKNEIKDIFGKLGSLERTTKSIFDRINHIEEIKIAQEISDKEDELNPDNLIKNILLIDCKGRNSCDTCVENLGCVWCGIKNLCTPGDMNGPHDLSCSISFSHRVCSSKSCEDFKNCKSCTENKSCGWCKSNNKCMHNGSFKANKGICPSGYVNKMNRTFNFFSRNNGNAEINNKC